MSSRRSTRRLALTFDIYREGERKRWQITISNATFFCCHICITASRLEVIPQKHNGYIRQSTLPSKARIDNFDYFSSLRRLSSLYHLSILARWVSGAYL